MKVIGLEEIANKVDLLVEEFGCPKYRPEDDPWYHVSIAKSDTLHELAPSKEDEKSYDFLAAALSLNVSGCPPERFNFN